MIKKWNHLRIAIAVSTATFTFVQPSFSQRIADNGKVLNEIVVTGTKVPADLRETGKNLLVIDSLQLDHSKGMTLADILNDQPGIVVSGFSNGFAAPKSVFINGALAQYTVILIDGVPLKDPSGSGQNVDINTIDLSAFDRIEILKGGESTLYGSDAVAGVINLISKKPANKPLALQTTFAGGTYETWKAQMNASGHVSKALGFLVNYTHLQTQGFPVAYDNGTDSLHRGHFQNDGFRQDALAVTLSIAPRTGWEISPFIRYSVNHGDYGAGAFMDAPNRYIAQNIVAGLTAQFHIKKASTLFLNQSDQYSRRSYFEGLPYQYFGRFNHSEAFFRSVFSNYVSAVEGISFQYDALLKSGAGSLKNNPDAHLVSPYLLFILKPSSKLKTELGVRFTHHSAYGNDWTYSFNPNYLLTDRVSFFFNAGTSFRAPDLESLYGPYSPNPTLRPETSLNLNLGSSVNAIKKKLKFQSTIFSRSIRNIIVYTPVKYLNQNKQKDLGLEVNTDYSLSPYLAIGGDYTLTTGKIVAPSSKGLDSSSYNLTRRPKHVIGLRLSLINAKGLTGHLQFRSFQSRTDQDFTALTTTYIKLPGYTLLNADFNYALRKNYTSFFIQFNNLLNTHYMEIYGFTSQHFNLMAGVVFKL